MQLVITDKLHDIMHLAFHNAQSPLDWALEQEERNLQVVSKQCQAKLGFLAEDNDVTIPSNEVQMNPKGNNSQDGEFCGHLKSRTNEKTVGFLFDKASL